MFRRHTDEVFSTLQQVQRRLSQNTEGGNDAVVPSSTRQAQTKPTRSQSTKRGGTSTHARSPFSINPGGGERPQHVVPVVDRSQVSKTAAVLPEEDLERPVYQQPQAYRRGEAQGLVLGTQASLMIAVLWIASLVGAYMLGGSRLSSESTPAPAPAPGGAGTRSLADIAAQADRTTSAEIRPSGSGSGGSRTGTQASNIQARGDHVLVLESSARFSQAGMERFQAVADRYNDLARQHADRGYQPWFGVRRPASGGLQLVFGALGEGVFGIPENDELARMMSREMRESRFPDAFWIRIR